MRYVDEPCPDCGVEVPVLTNGTSDCPECGADAVKHTYYLSPLSTVYEKEGDVHCAMCTNTWNDKEQSNE